MKKTGAMKTAAMAGSAAKHPSKEHSMSHTKSAQSALIAKNKTQHSKPR